MTSVMARNSVLEGLIFFLFDMFILVSKADQKKSNLANVHFQSTFLNDKRKENSVKFLQQAKLI